MLKNPSFKKEVQINNELYITKNSNIRCSFKLKNLVSCFGTVNKVKGMVVVSLIKRELEKDHLPITKSTIPLAGIYLM